MPDNSFLSPKREGAAAGEAEAEKEQRGLDMRRRRRRRVVVEWREDDGRRVERRRLGKRVEVGRRIERGDEQQMFAGAVVVIEPHTAAAGCYPGFGGLGFWEEDCLLCLRQCGEEDGAR